MNAFPSPHWKGQEYEGMDLRDYFAAKALQGMLASPNCDTEVNVTILSENSYVFADAMMKARSK